MINQIFVLTFAVIDALTLIACAAAIILSDDLSNYSSSHSIVDVSVACGLRALVLGAAAVMVNFKHGVRACYFAVGTLQLLLLCKLLLVSWTDYTALAFSCLCFSQGCFAYFAISRLSNEMFRKKDGPSMSLLGFLIILRPYFWPTGWFNRLRCIFTYMVLIASKGGFVF